MATKKQIQAWIPLAKEIFCSHMNISVAALPEIHIVSKKELLPVRAALVEKTCCHQKNIDVKRYESIMEMLHGDSGDAVIIQQSLIPSPTKNPMAECCFHHFLWHEFGHFYAIHHEYPDNDLHRFNDQELSQDKTKQMGYGRMRPASSHGSINLEKATSSAKKIIAAVLELFDRIVNPQLLIRRVNITANHVTTEAHEQERPQSFDLFADMDEQIREMEQEQRELAVQKAVLKIQHKYGKNAILKCNNLEEDAMTRERNEQIGGHRR